MPALPFVLPCGRLAAEPVVPPSAPSSSCLQTARLPDGALITLRAVRPTDLDSMRAAFDALSSETRYLRFHAHVSELPAKAWRYLTQVDGRDHVALVARFASRIVGVGRFIRLADKPNRAEIAFVIADDFQRRGVGSALRAALLERARVLGIDSFQASVVATNAGIRHLLEAPPLKLQSDSGDLLVLKVEL